MQVERHDTAAEAIRLRFGDDPLDTLRQRLARVNDRIAAACRRVGRDPADVRLLPITKTVPAEILRLAHQAGMSAFGENKVQEAVAKHAVLSDLPVSWSVVGHLQTNKARFLSGFASEFHALDSLRLADLLDRFFGAAGRTLDIYVQVNTSGEQSKYGLPPADLLPFLDGLARFRSLRPRGLMTLAVLHPDLARVRPCFALLRSLRDRARAHHPGIAELSMGMSGDFEAAIEEGADVVRVGRSLFGERPTPAGHYWPGEPVELGPLQ
ncbi:YggS family pyridoxal phosphate-dependent enzyme [Roseomonas eburnea]|uniref:Pyridoxal phosphate homeostasis protein n=1 Tax=Neoroseomonas eburnea TaxID=1346889 RepID=A0A9X9XB02_9PROT|nr:YggS family pyridoxal phosphate-dependent enzyme [Neoroseomonas eburnea]MBR0680888.1 YggS family pyridoxal phosphate-dependent enzyme [Neoroseomonas eburnea]